MGTALRNGVFSHLNQRALAAAVARGQDSGAERLALA
jgi:hypothetical protein